MAARSTSLHPFIVVAGCFLGLALQLRQGEACAALGCGVVAGIGAVLAVIVGSAWRHVQSRGMGPHEIAAPGVVAYGGTRAWCRLRVASACLLLLAVTMLAFGVVGWRAQARLAQSLDRSLEGVDIDVTGVVASLPRVSPDGTHFEFEIEAARSADGPVTLPPRVMLGWYREIEADAVEPPRVAAAERWRFTVRLKRPHGPINPHGFDFELWLFERGLAATGSVRANGVQQRSSVETTMVVERARQVIRDAIERRVAQPRTSGLLAALAIGDQSAIDRGDWDLYRVTGVAHLMSISGLHVTMFAWLAAAVVGALWRRSLRACLWCPAPTAARIGGVLLAAGYALLAGWGVPAQRTVWMLAAVVLLQVTGRRWPWPWVLAGAAFVVLVVDPWAALQAGFWLSFAAVALLMFAGGGSRDPEREPDVPVPAGHEVLRGGALRRGLAWAHGMVAGALRTQLIATVGLTPLTLLCFQQVSVVGFGANLVAIPLVTLVITPLALLGILAPPLWSAAAVVVDALHLVLGWMADMPWATWSVPVAPWWAQVAGLGAGLLAVAPLPWRVRVLAVPLALPLLVPAVERPDHGRFEIVAVDIGQGTAVLVRTHTRLLVFDTGPVYAPERNAGERVLLPLLRARGEPRIDGLVLSHQDTDHIGGAGALIAAMPIGELWSSLPDGHTLRRRGLVHHPCASGRSWQWDGVSFEMLHPLRYPDADAPGPKPNAMSCVLRVVDAQGQALLLTGDIEAAQEQQLLASGVPLRADALVVAHHGSKTSTTWAWLDAVRPRLGVVQAGYRNRYGHPAPMVEQRLHARGVQTFRSDRCGAWTWRGGDDAVCERERHRRYWHFMP